MLGAALCACILENIERFSHLLPCRYEAASIEVIAERDGSPARVALLHKNIRKLGTITTTLAAACELTGEIEALPSSAAR